MANPEHLDILKQGVDLWNQWRKEHLNIQPDLSGSVLHRNSLSEANLIRADLSKADLSKAQLRRANLFRATLTDANLFMADLNGAELIRVDLSRVNLTTANLIGANLFQADLSGANLTRAVMAFTIFGDVDLSAVTGLETVLHDGPSTIGIDTIYRSKGYIPEVFLKGAGIDDTFISYIRSLIGKPIEYYSCFISYSCKDEAFVRQLRADLLNNNVRCWFAPEDLKWGERTQIGLDKAIGLHDKLLLILSKYSIASGWVEHEVRTALAKERKDKRVVLFPIRVDKAVLESPLSWATEIRHERNIGDFTRWKDPDEYQKGLSRLLRDLKASSQP